MNTMNMPGFTADNSLYKTSGRYCAMSCTPNPLNAPALILALPRNPTADVDVDCKTFPDSITCNECNSFGSGTFDCCQLRRPGDICIIKNDPNFNTSRFPRFPGFPSILVNTRF